MIQTGLNIAVALLLIGQAQTSEPQGEQLELRNAVINADSPESAGRAFAAYFKSVSAIGPDWLTYYLKHDPNIGIALQAEWHDKVVSTPIWRKGQERYWILKPTDAQRFFGFLEGRTGLTIPTWWQSDGTFPSPEISEEDDWWSQSEELPEVLREKYRFNVEPGTVARKVDGGIRLSDGDHSIVLRDDVLVPLQEQYNLEVCNVTYRDGKAIVFFFDCLGTPSPLLCYDEATGDLEWTSKVWALGKFVGGTSGAWPMQVSVDFADHAPNSIVVWGKGVFGNYLEVFDAKNGKCAYRFCTNYWKAWNGE